MDFQCSCLLWEEDFDLTGSVLGFSFWRWFIEIPLLDVVCGGIVITVGLSFKYGDLLALTIKVLDSDEKYQQRQQRSVPALDKIKQWLDINSSKIAKGSLTRKALDYTLNQWPKLIRYCEHGDLNLSNVMAENAIRPFVIGRKAWLFADTPAGAKASALYYTLIETAKANGLEPYAYLSYVIGNMANAETVEQWEALLPWNMK